jgi:tryptophan-rich sensory protein
MVSTTLAKTTGAVVLAAALGGLASRPAQSDWYETLRKPRFQPPRQAFPIVWPLLYADVAVVSAGTVDELNDRGERGHARAYSILLALNLVLNGSWTWLFFSRRRFGRVEPGLGYSACIRCGARSPRCCPAGSGGSTGRITEASRGEDHG